MLLMLVALSLREITTLGVVRLTAVFQCLQCHSQRYGTRTEENFLCFAGRNITLSEGNAASPLLRGHWCMLFCHETACKYAFPDSKTVLVKTSRLAFDMSFSQYNLMTDYNDDGVHVNVGSNAWRA